MSSGHKWGSLSDYCPIQSVTEEGLIFDRDRSEGFIFSVEGCDGLLYDGADFHQLHERWRSFLRLQPPEEIQVVFRKGSDFEKLFHQKITHIEKVQGDFTRRLFWSQIEESLKDIEDLKILESSILVCYRRMKTKLKSQNELNDTNAFELSQKRQDLQLQLESMGLKAKALSHDEVYCALERAATGVSYLPLSGAQQWPAVSLKPEGLHVDDSHFRGLALKKLPESYSEMGMIQALTLLPLPIEFCVRFRGKDLEPVKKKIERRRQILFGMSARKATGDPVSEAQFKETDELIRRLNEQNDALCEMSLVVGIRGKDPLFVRRALTEILNTQGQLQQLEFEESPLSTFDCFLETLPWFRGKIFHQHSVLSSNAIHFLPFFEAARGDDEALVTFRTQYGSLYSLDPISNRLANYNWLVSGQSGAGKSFFVNSLLLQSLSLQPRIFIVDIGGSYNKLTQFLGGKLIHVDADAGFLIGPFFMPKSSNEKDERRRRAHIQLVFQEMLRDEGKLPSIEERSILSEALEPFFEMENLPEHPISELREKLSGSSDSKAKRLALLLKPWCHHEFFGSFVDHAKPLTINDDIVTFDLKGIKEFPDLSRVLELIITSALWSSLRDKKRFTWIVLDEVAFSLLKTQPGFVQELISTCRKMWAGTCIVVQGLETLTSNPAGAAILANTNFKAILTQRGDARGYEEPLGLKETEAQVIRGLSRRKGDYSDIFLMDDDRRAVLRYTPDALTYLLSTTDAQEVKALEDEMAQYSGTFAEKIFQLLERGRSL